ncbi:hypothetical protein F2P81_011987 [Scophthalmus maximus]|uniref:Uncharacterized protein n=1 Tax=Scophthalmus maximus TaxID=52904 RepID=A0A6A4SVF7_SCOMX|nr:hypothetical protein F2P81_011987 [Scophthalmus maximus]
MMASTYGAENRMWRVKCVHDLPNLCECKVLFQLSLLQSFTIPGGKLGSQSANDVALRSSCQRGDVFANSAAAFHPALTLCITVTIWRWDEDDTIRKFSRDLLTEMSFLFLGQTSCRWLRLYCTFT